MPKKILIGNGTLVTLGEENELIRGGAVLTEGDLIKDYGKTSDLKEKYDFDRWVDAAGKIIMPGFINAHHHLYSTFARGMAVPGKAPADFIEILENLWWELDRNLTEEAIYYSALIHLIESVRKGTTAIIDHHESQSCQLGSLDEIRKAVEEVGIRASLCLGTSDRYGHGQEGLEENERFLSELKSRPSELLRGMVGLHASFTVNNDTLDESVHIAEKFGVGVHFHCAEGEADQERNLEKYNQRVVERLDEHGALGEKSIAVHGVHLNEAELELLRKTNTNLIHNPESNMNNAVGYSDAPMMMENGIKVGLGTDGMSSDMLSQMRCAYLLHPHEKKDPRVGFSEAPKMLLENNPEILRRVTGWDVGEISRGKLADIILIDYNPPTPLNEETFMGHLIFGLVDAPVDTTICNGEVLMQDKELVGLEEENIAEQSSKIASEIWDKVQKT